MDRDALWKDEFPSVEYSAVRGETIARENRYVCLISFFLFTSVPIYTLFFSCFLWIVYATSLVETLPLSRRYRRRDYRLKIETINFRIHQILHKQLVVFCTVCGMPDVAVSIVILQNQK